NRSNFDQSIENASQYHDKNSHDIGGDNSALMSVSLLRARPVSGVERAPTKERTMPKTPSFFWYELLTTDPEAARDFYAGVIGWRPEAWGGADMAGKPYIVMNAGERGVG